MQRLPHTAEDDRQRSRARHDANAFRPSGRDEVATGGSEARTMVRGNSRHDGVGRTLGHQLCFEFDTRSEYGPGDLDGGDVRQGHAHRPTYGSWPGNSSADAMAMRRYAER